MSGSMVLVERTADGMKVRMPAPGIWKGYGGGIVAMLFVLAFSGGIGALMLRHPDRTALIVPAMFWIVALPMLAACVSLGRRSAELDLGKERLVVMWRGLVMRVRRQWPRAEVGEFAAVDLRSHIGGARLWRLEMRTPRGTVRLLVRGLPPEQRSRVPARRGAARLRLQRDTLFVEWGAPFDGREGFQDFARSCLRIAEELAS